MLPDSASVNPRTSLRSAPPTLRAAITQHASAHPGRSAVVRHDLDLTYADLAEAVDRCAALLRRSGITERSVAGISVADEVQHLVVSVAALALGARQVTLATHDTEAVRSDCARQVQVTDVISSRDEHRLPGAGFVRLPADPRFRDVRPAPGEGACDDPGGVLYLKTSGTTGRMRIVAFEQAQVAEQARRHANYADERFLRLASIEHNNSKRHRLYGVFAGGTAVFRDAGPTPVDELCRRHAITCVDASRLHISDLAYGERRGGGRLLDGIKLRTGGSFVPGALRRALEERVTTELYVRYAATECGAISMAMPGEHDDTDPAGRPIDGVTIEVVGPDDVVLPRGAIGQLRLKAPGMAAGYHGDPEATERRFRDGWFHPGDSASIREDGVLLVHGRADDMIILNGLNIYPAEIERTLERHPSVRAAAALPVESAVHGQIPVAAVELHDGAVATGSELLGWARDQLALRAPRRIAVMAALPRNSQGKIAKLEIAAMMRGAPR